MKRRVKKFVSIIVPGFNEEKNIGRVIKDCLKLRKYFPVEIIAVESGSKDKTAQVAEKAGAKRVLSFPDKRGKGADFWAAGIVSTGDYIVQIDADYQFQPYEIPLFVKELDKGADVVIGTRFAGGNVEEGSVNTKNLFGNYLVSYIASLGAGIKITDVMAGFKAFRRDAFLALDIRERHFEYEAETVVKAVRKGMKLKQIPITYKKRIGGQSGIKALRDGFMVSLAVLKVHLNSNLRPFKRKSK